MQIAEEAIRSGAIGLIVVDSVAALTPKREIDGEVGDAHIGLLARLMSQTCRMITGPLRLTNTTIVFINQYREAMSVGSFGGPTRKATGGMALEYYSSVIIEMTRTGTNKSPTGAESNKTQAKITKNKVGAPYRIAEFDIIFGEGIDWITDVINTADSLGLITKNGKWYYLGEEKFNGIAQFVSHLKENQEALNGLKSGIHAAASTGHTVLVGVPEPESSEAE
jgi:recombination protein RecA